MSIDDDDDEGRFHTHTQPYTHCTNGMPAIALKAEPRRRVEALFHHHQYISGAEAAK